MDQYRWAPLAHPDPPEDQPLGVEPDSRVLATPELPPVWLDVEFTRTGRQRLPGFVERASNDLVEVQVVHMGFSHRHLWLPRERVTKRVLKQTRRPREG